tara:strand:- start:390 stop:611 length:222 start_codon:yes stop_codon:yes gene_type:complete
MNLSQKEKVLLSFLGVIFIAQIFFLGADVFHCRNDNEVKGCLETRKRVEVTFAGMTATVLALITNIGTGRSIK